MFSRRWDCSGQRQKRLLGGASAYPTRDSCSRGIGSFTGSRNAQVSSEEGVIDAATAPQLPVGSPPAPAAKKRRLPRKAEVPTVQDGLQVERRVVESFELHVAQDYVRLFRGGACTTETLWIWPAMLTVDGAPLRKERQAQVHICHGPSGEFNIFYRTVAQLETPLG